MKLNTTDFRRKLQHPLLLALAGFPLVLFLVAQHAPEAIGLMWVLPAVYVLLAWVCLLLPGKLRLPGGLAGIAVMIAVTAAAWPIAAHLVLLVPIVVYTVLMLIALPMGRWEHGRELGLEWPVIGMGTHVLVQLLINGAQKMGNTAFDDCEGMLVVSFLALAVLVVLAMNRTSLNSASQSRQSIPLLMRRQNLVLVLSVLVIGVLISLIPAIGQALSWVWDQLMQLLLLIGAFLASIMPQQKSGGGTAGGGDIDPLVPGAAAEPSQLALIMEKVMTVLTVGIIVVGAFFILKMLGKRLKKLLRYLWEKLGKYSAAVGEDYEDEVTSTREDDAERESLLGRLRRFAPEDERGLDASQRVRVRYRSLKRRRRWTTASTARETLPEEAARLYERARYSGEALTDEEAERFRDATKKV
jgi:ABC-type multidrug transport system fused ATPase/permease subunit